MKIMPDPRSSTTAGAGADAPSLAPKNGKNFMSLPPQSSPSSSPSSSPPPFQSRRDVARAPSSATRVSRGLMSRPPHSAASPPTFKLRPRSNSHPLPEAEFAATVIPPLEPLRQRQRSRGTTTAHTISPDGPAMHPAPSRRTQDGDGPLVPPIPSKMPPPPPTFATFFVTSSSGGCSSPIKKQRTQADRTKLTSSPDHTSHSDDDSEDSRHEDSSFMAESPLADDSSSNAVPVFPSSISFLSTPPREVPSRRISGNSSSNGKRSFPEETANNAGQDFLPTIPSHDSSSPFTPRSRRMMQNLCIGDDDSPSPPPPRPPPALSSMNSPTPSTKNTPPPKPSASSSPENVTGSSRSQPLMLSHQRLPNVPTFSFSPSLHKGGHLLPNGRSRSNSITNPADPSSSSASRDTILFSTGSTPLATPIRSSFNSSSGGASPFARVGRGTPIGHQRGSVFKTLPPRGGLYPNGRSTGGDSDSSANNSPVPPPTGCGTFATSSPSAFSATPSPSPRMVPLTVLSQDGSPLITAMTNMPQLYEPSEPSPLMRSLDQIAKEDEWKEGAEGKDVDDLLSPRLDVKMPSILSVQASPMSSGEGGHHLLPRIKLTPRGKSCFLTAKMDASHCLSLPSEQLDDAMSLRKGGAITMPRLALRSRRPMHGSSPKPASSFLNNVPGDKEAAEMDSLLNGFDKNQGTESKFEKNDEEFVSSKSKFENNDSGPDLCRVESEEAEMVALTSGSWQMPSLWLPPVRESGDGHRAAPVCADANNANRFSQDITLNLSSLGQERRPRSLSLNDDRSPRFPPHRAPLAQPKSRSLFDGSNARSDPLERILRADAIAEAARSDEPLTDEDSDDGDNGGFLLCLPGQAGQDSQGGNSISPKKKFPYKASHAARAESPLMSPSFGKPRSGRRTKCDSFHNLTTQPGVAPTIFEEGLATTMDKGLANYRHPMPTLEGSLQGLNKRETSDATFTTFCSLSDCDVSDIMASPKYSRMRALCSSRDRQSMCSMLSVSSSLCGLDIVQEASMGIEGSNVGHHDRFPVLSQSNSSEIPCVSSGIFKPLRSELSLNSLGLSVDSLDVGCAGEHQRDLFTPPVPGGAARNGAKRSLSPRDLFTPPVGADPRTAKQMLSPPPLKCRESSSPVPFNDAYQPWS